MTNSNRTETHGLRVDAALYALIKDEILPGTGVAVDDFFASLARLVAAHAPRNRELLDRRNALQAELDAWYGARKGQQVSAQEHREFLRSIGYIADDPGPVRASASNVDAEIASVAGPQLVVPVDNARYALNAANARWGSLYDALYGTNVVAEDDGAERGAAYNPVRGARVVAYAAKALDTVAPLEIGSHADATRYALDGDRLRVTLAGGETVGLATPAKFVGYAGEPDAPSSIVLRNHGLHMAIVIDPSHPVGAAHAAGVADVHVESAITTIMDCEDSVAAVDAEDKRGVYRNWAGIMRGDLATGVDKGGKRIERRLNPDREYRAPGGGSITLAGRSVLLVRNVGLHMYTDAVTDAEGNDIPEGLLDAMVTIVAAKHDLAGTGPFRNSRTGSVYVVKPKMHGPEEVAFACRVFADVERALGLAENTVKIGMMEEERRTTVNLKACIAAAADRLIFINTGFLDRTGDEIHSIMAVGAVIPKMEMKNARWLSTYEANSVDTGLACGLNGVAQIGKGMWAAPDEMAQMMDTKLEHPMSGATTAWVPSPTAATLHALHYHDVEVAARHGELAAREPAQLEGLLEMPTMHGRNLSAEEIQAELDNNAQGILGYVVRWIQQGIGCSKVPDIDNVALMEDRATLRISSQHIANWLHHGLVTERQVRDTFERMAAVVDGQNAGDPLYRNMAPDCDSSVAYAAALDLVLKGVAEPNGYTEPTLHARRREFKAALAA